MKHRSTKPDRTAHIVGYPTESDQIRPIKFMRTETGRREGGKSRRTIFGGLDSLCPTDPERMGEMNGKTPKTNGIGCVDLWLVRYGYQRIRFLTLPLSSFGEEREIITRRRWQ